MAIIMLIRLWVGSYTLCRWLGPKDMAWQDYPWAEHSAYEHRFARYVRHIGQRLIPITAVVIAVPFVPAFAAYFGPALCLFRLFGYLYASPGRATIVTCRDEEMPEETKEKEEGDCNSAYMVLYDYTNTMLRMLEGTVTTEDKKENIIKLAASAVQAVCFMKKNIIMLASGAVQAVWLSFVAYSFNQIQADTYTCSYSKISLFTLALDMDSVASYLVFIMASSVLCVIFFLLLMKFQQCFQKHIASPVANLFHYTWIVASLQKMGESDRVSFRRAVLHAYVCGPLIKNSVGAVGGTTGEALEPLRRLSKIDKTIPSESVKFLAELTADDKAKLRSRQFLAQYEEGVSDEEVLTGGTLYRLDKLGGSGKDPYPALVKFLREWAADD